MRVLVACEESQAITKAFRDCGHEAYSSDLQSCSGGHPEWHIKGDCFDVIKDEWDLLIAHPVCTYLSNSGSRWLYKKDNRPDQKRWCEMYKGRDFFMRFLGHEVRHIPRVVVENPIPHGHANLPPYTQCIQPWMFGDLFSKATCLWVIGLPPLVPYTVIKPPGVVHACHKEPPGPDRAKKRSKTYPGIARAMALQWGTDWRP